MQPFFRNTGRSPEEVSCFPSRGRPSLAAFPGGTGIRASLTGSVAGKGRWKAAMPAVIRTGRQGLEECREQAGTRSRKESPKPDGKTRKGKQEDLEEKEGADSRAPPRSLRKPASRYGPTKTKKQRSIVKAGRQLRQGATGFLRKPGIRADESAPALTFPCAYCCTMNFYCTMNFSKAVPFPVVTRAKYMPGARLETS